MPHNELGDCVQKVFILTFDNTYRITRHIKRSIRELILFFCFAILMYMYFFSSVNVVSNRAQLYGSVIVMIATIFSVAGKPKRIKWNKSILYPLIGFAVGILLISLLHSVGEGYIIYAIDLIAIFPAFYFVWANRGDYETLLRLLSSATLFLGEISFVYCFYLAINGDLVVLGSRVAGIRANPNTFGRLGVIVVLASLFLLLISIKKKPVMISASFGLGIGLSYVLLSASRTSLLATAICIVTFAISLVKEYRKLTTGRLLLIFLLAALSSIILLVGLQLNDIDFRAKQKEKEVAVQLEKDAANPQSSKENTDEKEIISSRIKQPGNINTISSGRVNIWKLYWEHSSVLGSEYEEIKDFLPKKETYWAHNNILEYIFRFGYIVGFIYAIYFVIQGCNGITILFNKNFSSAVAYFTTAAIGIFSLIAMLDVAVLPFAGCIPCIYYLSITPIIVCEERNGG